MANNGRDMTLNDIQSSLQDIKQHMHWMYELLGTGVDEGRVAAADVKYLANQMDVTNIGLMTMIGTHVSSWIL